MCRIDKGTAARGDGGEEILGQTGWAFGRQGDIESLLQKLQIILQSSEYTSASRALYDTCIYIYIYKHLSGIRSRNLPHMPHAKVTIGKSANEIGHT